MEGSIEANRHKPGSVNYFAKEHGIDPKSAETLKLYTADLAPLNKRTTETRILKLANLPIPMPPTLDEPPDQAA